MRYSLAAKNRPFRNPGCGYDDLSTGTHERIVTSAYERRRSRFIPPARPYIRGGRGEHLTPEGEKRTLVSALFRRHDRERESRRYFGPRCRRLPTDPPTDRPHNTVRPCVPAPSPRVRTDLRSRSPQESERPGPLNGDDGRVGRRCLPTDRLRTGRRTNPTRRKKGTAKSGDGTLFERPGQTRVPVRPRTTRASRPIRTRSRAGTLPRCPPSTTRRSETPSYDYYRPNGRLSRRIPSGDEPVQDSFGSRILLFVSDESGDGFVRTTSRTTASWGSGRPGRPGATTFANETVPSEAGNTRVDGGTRNP